MTDAATLEFIRRSVADPIFLLDSIDKQLASAPIDDLPLTTLDATPGSEPYRAVESGVPRHRVLDAVVAPKAGSLESLICLKLRYCELKKRHKDEVTLITTVCDALISAAITFPIPVATVTTYCVQSLMLDRLCKCTGTSPEEGRTSGT